jgi:hypothetical protein
MRERGESTDFDTRAGPEHRGSLACDIPREACSRRKSLVIGIVKSAAVLLHHAGGLSGIEVGSVVAAYYNRRLQFVAQPQIHRHSAAQPEIVSKINSVTVDASATGLRVH